MSLQQHQVMKQKLSITNEMKQSLAILQMPVNELAETIQNELDENPLLEACYLESEVGVSDRIIEKDFDKNDVFFDDEKQSPFDRAGSKRILKDFLYEQLFYLREPKDIKFIMVYMIENIDEKGYLSCSVKDIIAEIAVMEEKVLYCLSILQDFYPSGVFARNFKECLTIQLRKKNVNIKHIYDIVERYLPLLSKNKIKEIARKLGVSVSEAVEYCNIIKGLEPKPSRGFDEEADRAYIIPDAYIQRTGDVFTVSINEDAVPRLKISRGYKQILSSSLHEDAKQYISDRFNTALYLIKSVEKRRSTLYDVLSAIVSEQSEYFISGCRNLKPMTISRIADVAGYHESTVSRAIRDKYVQMPSGLVPIKSLFSSKCGAGSQVVSSVVIKNRIQLLIQNENKELPFSDQQIVNVLLNDGMEVSRRTVAKYRGELNIPSSDRRREFIVLAASK